MKTDLFEVHRYFSCFKDLDVRDVNPHYNVFELIVRGSIQYQVRVICKLKTEI
jgi:hypothetical protein